jgi:exodeoxyribonuclease V alpha subunit
VIASGTVPVTRLTTIFRQAQGSHIILNAHRVNQGKLPIFEKDSQDFFLFPAQEAEKAAHWVEDVTCQRIPDKFGLDPLHEVQVLAPMYRGLAGVDNLNVQLQARLNPKQPQAPEKALYGQVFRVGDKVMQTQNDYQKDVYNGDIGFVTGIDFADQALNVDFQGQRVRYDWTEGDQLVHAYAVSVHKAQGSEFPAVVIPILTQHYVMLQRNLIYTAITRAKSLCVLVGNRKALAIAVNNNQVAERFSALGWRLTLEKKKATL